MKASFAIYLILVFFLGLCACRHPLFSKNYRDKLGRRQGRWKVYYDSGNKHLYYKGRYVNGQPRGNTKYYYQDGRILEIEKARGNIIETTFYYPGGATQLHGSAQWILQGDSLTYHWIGPWEKYDSTGKLVEVQTYRNGKMIWRQPVK